MNGDLLCRWLGLAGKHWPVDAHTLLGVPPGETDLVRIETCVQKRMASLRCYQITHPEEATEGMNRVAQAFVTLSESAVKPAQSMNDTVVGNSTQLDWNSAPPPVRREEPAPSVAPRRSDSTRETITSLARESPEAKAGLTTLQAVEERIAQTRGLARILDKVGHYFKDPKRPLAPAEERDLTAHMEALFDVMEEYPRFVGQPGQPGYRVVALARLQMTAQMFQALDRKQRALLAKDWRVSRQLLMTHRQFLDERLATLKATSPIFRWLQAGGMFLWDYRYWFVAGLGTVAGGLWWLVR